MFQSIDTVALGSWLIVVSLAGLYAMLLLTSNKKGSGF